MLALFYILFCKCQTSAWGYISYELLSKPDATHTTYKVNLTLYRDCLPGNTDFEDGSGIYMSAFDAVSHQLSTDISMQNPIRTIISSQASQWANACVEQAIYTGTTTLVNNAAGYDITWQRCCRATTVTNLLNPNSVGFALTAYIPPASNMDNSAPVWNGVQGVQFLCAGDANTFDLSVTDVEGDSIGYEFTNPWAGGDPNIPQPFASPPPFALVLFQQPYSLTSPLGTNSTITYNATGSVDANPANIGVFQMGIKLSEYRNHVLIAEHHSEFTAFVLNCPVSIGKAENRIEAKIYPNPVENTLFIETEEDVISAEIWNMNGQLLEEISEIENGIAVERFQAGLYLLKIHTKKGISWQKWMKD